MIFKTGERPGPEGESGTVLEVGKVDNDTVILEIEVIQAVDQMPPADIPLPLMAGTTGTPWRAGIQRIAFSLGFYGICQKRLSRLS
jgi:hypothetical protein